MRRFFLLVLVMGTCGESYASYTYTRTITISSANVSTINGTNLSNFPVLFSTSGVTFSTAASGGHMKTAYDLVFSTKSDCSYLLNWDTETVNNTGTTTANIWIEVPFLSTTTITAATIYACYGNAAITTYQGKATSTWDSNYVGVWHLPNGSILTANDSTSNANNWTSDNIGSHYSAATGNIDGGAVNDGGGYLGFPDSASLRVTTTLTISMWININNFGQTNKYLLSKQITGQGDNTYAILFDYHAHQTTFYSSNMTGQFTYSNAGSDINIPDLLAWHYITYTLDDTGADDGRAYLDGVDQNGKVALGGHPAAGTGTFTLGTFNIANASTYATAATMDEVRISNVARSADWIKTEYNNQNSPSTFVTVGSETNNSTTGITLNIWGNGLTK